MANRRQLKKEIRSISVILFSDVLSLFITQPKNIDKTKMEQILSRIDRMNEEFIFRAQRPSGEGGKTLIKQYYHKLREALSVEAETISKEIQALNQTTGEQA